MGSDKERFSTPTVKGLGFFQLKKNKKTKQGVLAIRDFKYETESRDNYRGRRDRIWQKNGSYVDERKIKDVEVEFGWELKGLESFVVMDFQYLWGLVTSREFQKYNQDIWLIQILFLFFMLKCFTNFILSYTSTRATVTSN